MNTGLVVGVFAVLVATASVGCNRVESDWDHAKQANSVPAYTDFISKHPTAAQVEEAKLAIKGIALKAAITGGDVATLQSLTAESPGIVTQKDLDGRSPLHWAAYAGARQSLIELLLKAKADINAKDHNGDTPLDIAVSSQHNDAAKFLKQQGGKYGRFPTQFVGVWIESGSSTHDKITIKPDQLIWERDIAGNKDAEVVGLDKVSISREIGLSLEFPATEKREVTMGGQPATMSEEIDVDAALEKNTLKLRYHVGTFGAFGAISGPGTYAGMVGSRDVERTFARE